MMSENVDMDDSNVEYQAGQEAAHTWLTGPGRGYLDPNDDSDLMYPDDAGRSEMYEQGFSDALKGISWHAQNPGEVCHRGEACRDWKWLASDTEKNGRESPSR